MEAFKDYVCSNSLAYAKFLKHFVGDTIVMEFDPSAHLTTFTVETPDTVWIKERPKKNPKLGKHYLLSNAYKGVMSDKNNFFTPATAVNGKPFAVYSVEAVSDYRIDCKLRLLDLETLNIVNFVLYESFPESFQFTSAKTQRMVKSMEGQKVYYCPDLPYYSGTRTPTFTECTYLNGDFYFEVTKAKGYSHYDLTPHAQMRVQDADGTVYSFSPLMESLSTRPVILSQSEYDSNFKPQTIESEVDFSVLQDNIDLPISGIAILAQTSSYAPVYQTIDPTASYNSAPAHLSSELILIGDKVSIGGKDYYKACYNGKAFFIQTDNVTLLPGSEAQIDSVVSCPKEVRYSFFKKVHWMNKQLYVDNLKDGIDAVNSYAKYGLAIPKWGVYDVSEYTDGTGIRFTFYNPTQKTVKYVTVTFQGYNAVDDPVGSSITRKCIGPIKPDETGTYDYDYAWHTDIVEYAKIKSIIVQYMDGTSKTISNPKSIMFNEKLQDFFYSTDPVEDLD
jgi:hypothetical protein